MSSRSLLSRSVVLTVSISILAVLANFLRMNGFVKRFDKIRHCLVENKRGSWSKSICTKMQKLQLEVGKGDQGIASDILRLRDPCRPTVLPTYHPLLT